MVRTLKIITGEKSKEFSFFDFTKHILGYDRLTSVHEEWAKEVDTTDRRKLFLKPRGTYKSTIYTVAYPLWKLINNPNERILIANATSENAEAFLREITTHLLRNDRFISLFGKLIESHTAKVSSITLKSRTSFNKEPSISTIGVLGTLVSAHYSTIICDDLANDKDRESESIREKKKKWLQDLISVLDPDGEIIVVGTRWHYNDLYKFIIEDLNSKLKPEERWNISIESCYLEDEKTPRFPSILSEEILERLKIEKGPLEFSSQYVNKPLPQEAQIFFEDDFKTFEYLGMGRVLDGDVVKTVEFVGYCDLSIGKSKSSDFTAIITLGKDKDGSVYLIDAVLERMPPDRTMDMIFIKHKIFNYRNFGIESNVFQSLFSEQMKKLSLKNESYLPIIEVTHSSNKQLRIQSLQPLIKQGVLKIRNDWRGSKDLKELMNQFIYFPLAGHDDGPDATEGAFSLLKKSGRWTGKSFFHSTEFKSDITGFDGNLDMTKFEINMGEELTGSNHWEGNSGGFGGQ